MAYKIQYSLVSLHTDKHTQTHTKSQTHIVCLPLVLITMIAYKIGLSESQSECMYACLVPAHFANSHFAKSQFANSHLANSYFASSHFAIPISSISHFANSQFANSHLTTSKFANFHFAISCIFIGNCPIRSLK